jgi:hypothetical protein
MTWYSCSDALAGVVPVTGTAKSDFSRVLSRWSTENLSCLPAAPRGEHGLIRCTTGNEGLAIPTPSPENITNRKTVCGNNY